MLLAKFRPAIIIACLYDIGQLPPLNTCTGKRVKYYSIASHMRSGRPLEAARQTIPAMRS
jgi:hypothetical protein